jgi:tetratricopeptide (TPR) repeat protein
MAAEDGLHPILKALQQVTAKGVKENDFLPPELVAHIAVRIRSVWPVVSSDLLLPPLKGGRDVQHAYLLGPSIIDRWHLCAVTRAAISAADWDLALATAERLRAYEPGDAYQKYPVMLSEIAQAACEVNLFDVAETALLVAADHNRPGSSGCIDRKPAFGEDCILVAQAALAAGQAETVLRITRSAGWDDLAVRALASLASSAAERGASDLAKDCFLEAVEKFRALSYNDREKTLELVIHAAADTGSFDVARELLKERTQATPLIDVVKAAARAHALDVLSGLVDMCRQLYGTDTDRVGAFLSIAEGAVELGDFRLAREAVQQAYEMARQDLPIRSYSYLTSATEEMLHELSRVLVTVDQPELVLQLAETARRAQKRERNRMLSSIAHRVADGRAYALAVQIAESVEDELGRMSTFAALAVLCFDNGAQDVAGTCLSAAQATQSLFSDDNQELAVEFVGALAHMGDFSKAREIAQALTSERYRGAAFHRVAEEALRQNELDTAFGAAELASGSNDPMIDVAEAALQQGAPDLVEKAVAAAVERVGGATWIASAASCLWQGRLLVLEPLTSRRRRFSKHWRPASRLTHSRIHGASDAQPSTEKTTKDLPCGKARVRQPRQDVLTHFSTLYETRSSTTTAT